MRTLWKAAAVAAVLSVAYAAPAKADSFGLSFGNGGVGFSYDSGGYCDSFGCPDSYWDLPLYDCPVYWRGEWYRGPVYYRRYHGREMYWLHGDWRYDGWNGARPGGACTGRYRPALGFEYYERNGFHIRDDWSRRWYRDHGRDWNNRWRGPDHRDGDHRDGDHRDRGNDRGNNWFGGQNGQHDGGRGGNDRGGNNWGGNDRGGQHDGDHRNDRGNNAPGGQQNGAIGGQGGKAYQGAPGGRGAQPSGTLPGMTPPAGRTDAAAPAREPQAAPPSGQSGGHEGRGGDRTNRNDQTRPN